jgi:Innexin
MMCYTPKWLWDCWENNLMRTLVMGLNIGMRTEDDKNKKKKVLIDYLLKHIKVNILGAHSSLHRFSCFSCIMYHSLGDGFCRF